MSSHYLHLHWYLLLWLVRGNPPNLGRQSKIAYVTDRSTSRSSRRVFKLLTAVTQLDVDGPYSDA